MTLTPSRIIAVCLLTLASIIPPLIPTDGYATKYGTGKYGRCQYQTCAVSLSSLATVNVNVLPAVGQVKCSVAKDTATVTTSSSTGYVLTLINVDNATNLTSGANTIASTAGTYASPAVLSANTWGYRVDSQGNFGAGPTSAVSSGSVPTLTFAKVQPSSGTADTLVSSSSAATNGVATSIWYGVCVNASQPSGSYADSVLYTALVN